MWFKRLTSYLLNNPVQTVAIAFAITFIPVLGVVGILIAALITLRKGVIEGAIVTVAATLPYMISFFMGRHSGDGVSPLMLWAAAGVAISSNILTWVFAVMMRQKTSLSNILQIAALLGVLVISVLHMAFPNIVDWWGSELQALSIQATAVGEGIKESAVKLGETQLNAINLTKQYATGVMAVGVLFNAVIQLLIARMWLASIFYPSSAVREFRHIRLNHLAGVLFVLSLVFSYIGNSVVLDIMPVLYGLFCVAGLSLIHYIFGLWASSMRLFWMALMYVVIILSTPVSIMILAMVALLDIGLDVRKRLTKV